MFYSNVFISFSGLQLLLVHGLISIENEDVLLNVRRFGENLIGGRRSRKFTHVLINNGIFDGRIN